MRICWKRTMISTHRILPAVTFVVLMCLSMARLSSGVPPRDKRCYNSLRQSPVNLTSCSELPQCRCSHLVLDCSNTTGFVNIPLALFGRFYKFQVLNFSYNNLIKINDTLTLQKMSRRVLKLDLYNNNLTSVVPDLFKILIKLKRLLIGGNLLGYDQLRAVLRAPSLRRLEIRCGRLGDFPDSYFANLSFNILTYLDLSWNNMEFLDMGVLRPQRRLEVLIIANNKIAKVKTDLFPYLLKLDLHKNKIDQFPVTCGEGGKSLFPRLSNLILVFNDIESIPDPVCLPNLRKLSLTYNQIQRFTTNMFSIHKFPSLRSLQVGEMSVKIREIQAFTFNNSNVNNLDLFKLNVDFSDASYVHLDAFKGCPNVTRLILTGCSLRQVSLAHFHGLFGELGRLRIMQAGKTDLQLVNNLFDVMPDLERLDLYRNSLTSLPDGCFDKLGSLQNLSLDGNLLTVISSSAFSPQTIQRLKRIDLTGNRLECSCDILPLKKWIETYPAKFVTYRDNNYSCSNWKDTLVFNFAQLPQGCLTYYLEHASLLTSTEILMLAVLAVILILRSGPYRIVAKRRRTPPRGGPIAFDVFVAYDSDDKHWVFDNLLPVIEGNMNLKACVHERDFTPGRDIMSNINTFLERSEMFLLVFSPNFALSGWCIHEMKLISDECHRNNKHQLPVILSPLNGDLFPSVEDAAAREALVDMRSVLNTVTYLDWTREDKDVFWKRLRDALGDILTINHIS